MIFSYTSEQLQDNIMSLLNNNEKFTVSVFDSLPSTNTYAKEYFTANELDEKYHIIIAREQTNGRGRLGKSFVSAKDTGLYLSFVFRPSLSTSEISLITSYVACATHRVLQLYTTKELKIKWVNDIYLENKKCAGILCESNFNSRGECDFVVVGIGIDISPRKFEKEIEDIATYIFDEVLDLNIYSHLIADLCETLSEYEKIITKRLHIPYYREKSYLSGKFVDLFLGDTITSAKVIGISDNAELVVQYKDETIESISSGEVSVRLNKTQ